jgi:hypothetical protein
MQILSAWKAMQQQWWWRRPQPGAVDGGNLVPMPDDIRQVLARPIGLSRVFNKHTTNKLSKKINNISKVNFIMLRVLTTLMRLGNKPYFVSVM